MTCRNMASMIFIHSYFVPFEKIDSLVSCLTGPEKVHTDLLYSCVLLICLMVPCLALQSFGVLRSPCRPCRPQHQSRQGPRLAMAGYSTCRQAAPSLWGIIVHSWEGRLLSGLLFYGVLSFTLFVRSAISLCMPSVFRLKLLLSVLIPISLNCSS